MTDSASWEAALLELFGGGWTFAAAGPRKNDDWRRDVLSVMALKVNDPRKWRSINLAPQGPGGEAGPDEPFLVDWSLDEFESLLYTVGELSASQLLIALQGEHYQACNIPDFENRRERLFAYSEEILSRFGPEATYYTNVAQARENPNADLLNPDSEWNCLSNFTTDCGVIVVSGSEVGVFWAFFED
ncbi:hypothetical protein [Streptomyces sp. cg40]|uniref:hypothetical protein n=1 Tax=Streptomyces sp. cg40 TaxID=3419764 RepID=UPI003CFD96EC